MQDEPVFLFGGCILWLDICECSFNLLFQDDDYDTVYCLALYSVWAMDTKDGFQKTVGQKDVCRPCRVFHGVVGTDIVVCPYRPSSSAVA